MTDDKNKTTAPQRGELEYRDVSPDTLENEGRSPFVLVAFPVKVDGELTRTRVKLLSRLRQRRSSEGTWFPTTVEASWGDLLPHIIKVLGGAPSADLASAPEAEPAPAWAELGLRSRTPRLAALEAAAKGICAKYGL